LYALSTVDGTEQWSVDVCKDIETSPAVDGSKVYVSGGSGNVAAMSALDGKLEWSQEVDGALFGSPIVVESTLFVPSIESGILAFETADGTKRWQFNTGEPILGSLAVANGTLYAADETGTVYALSHGDPEGLFGLGLTDDLLRIGVGGGIAGLAIGTMYKLFKRAFEADTNTDDWKQQ
jgi:outer membrane protein assembly factor BamB